jgi:hypothetical protein
VDPRSLRSRSGLSARRVLRTSIILKSLRLSARSAYFGWLEGRASCTSTKFTFTTLRCT